MTGVELADETEPGTTRRLPWPAIVASTVVLVVCVLPLRGLLRAPGAPMEEGFMLVFPERVLKGDIPNKDFLHLYGPGSLWVLAAVYKVFGVSLWSERIVAFAQQLGIVFGMLALLRPWGWRVATAGAVVTAVVIIPPIGLTALAWDGGVALGLLSIGAGALAGRTVAARRASRWALAAGLLAGFALLYRADLLIAVGLASAAVLWRLAPAARRRFAVGVGVGVLPYVIHLATAGVGNVIDGMFLEPVFDLRGGRRLPIPPSFDHFDGFLQKAGELLNQAWPFPAPGRPAQLALWLILLLLSAAFVVVAGVLAVRRDRTSDAAHALLTGSLFAAGLLPQALQRVDSAHLAWVGCVTFGLLPAAVASVLRQRAAGWPETRRVIVAIATPVVLLGALVPHFTLRSYGDYVAQSFGMSRDSHTIRRGSRVFYYGRYDAVVAANALLVDADRISEPGDRLFVGTGDLRKTPYSEAFLYYLLPELPPATRYIEMDPGVANAPDSGLADELAESDIVILSSIRDDWDEPNDSRVFGPDEPNQVLARDFCLVGSYGTGLFGRGLYELYERC